MEEVESLCSVPCSQYRVQVPQNVIFFAVFWVDTWAGRLRCFNELPVLQASLCDRCLSHPGHSLKRSNVP